jgi:hypothetical protein
VPEFRAEPVKAPTIRTSSAGWIRPTGDALQFETASSTGSVKFRPFNQILRQRYAVYWRTDA